MYAFIRLRIKLLLLTGAAALFFLLFFALSSRPASNARPAMFVSKRETADVPAGTDSRTVPVLMYHSVCDHPTVRSAYILSPAAFRSDLGYLTAHGYRPVSLRALEAFAAGTGSLPEKPVVLTFDDGFYNILTNVLPLLSEADAVAELNVVGAYADAAGGETYRSPNYSYLTWEEIRTLQKSGCFEIGSHTYDMHTLSPRNGCAKRRDESEKAYAEALLADTEAMASALRREAVDAAPFFAYPFGAKSESTQSLLEQAGFTVFLTCEEHLNVITANEPLSPLGRINRDAALSTEAFMQRHGIF